MVHFLAAYILSGSAGGFLLGMLGVGTGLIVVPLLTFLLPRIGIPSSMAIHTAIATSMAIIVIVSASSILNHHRLKNISWRVFRRIIIFSILGGCIGATIASHLPSLILERLFSVFMITTSIKMLWKKEATEIVELPEPLTSIPFFQLATVGFGIGMISCVLGVSGSVLMVPFLRSRRLAMRYAVGTSTIISFPVMLAGSLVYLILGFSMHPPMPGMLGFIYLPALFYISIAGFIFAYMGTRLVVFVSGKTLQRVFAILLAIMGIKMLI